MVASRRLTRSTGLRFWSGGRGATDGLLQQARWQAWLRQLPGTLLPLQATGKEKAE